MQTPIYYDLRQPKLKWALNIKFIKIFGIYQFQQKKLNVEPIIVGQL